MNEWHKHKAELEIRSSIYLVSKINEVFEIRILQGNNEFTLLKIFEKLDTTCNRMPRNRLPRVMKYYSPTGRRNHGRPLKRFLDTWDRNGSTNGPNPWKIYDDDDDDDDFFLWETFYLLNCKHDDGVEFESYVVERRNSSMRNKCKSRM